MIDLVIVTPQGEEFNQEVDQVVVRGLEGDLAIMTSTAPLVTPLAPGQVAIYQGTQVKRGTHSEGYVSVKDDKATLVTDDLDWE